MFFYFLYMFYFHVFCARCTRFNYFCFYFLGDFCPRLGNLAIKYHRTLHLPLIRVTPFKRIGRLDSLRKQFQGDKEQIFPKQLNSDKVQRTLEAAKLEYNVNGAVSGFVECLISASR